ncbi:unnamed protein product, partial [Prorocentrum cordatum]
ARLTGTKFIVDLQYTDNGRCALDPSSPPVHDFPEFEGYIACMTIKAARSWTTLERTSVVGAGPSWGGLLPRGTRCEQRSNPRIHPAMWN